MEPGKWNKIEMRLKINDEGQSNGEFIFFFNDVLTNHLSGMSDMIPDISYHLTHSRFWVYNNNPGADNDQDIYFKNYFVKKFSSDLWIKNATKCQQIKSLPVFVCFLLIFLVFFMFV